MHLQLTRRRKVEIKILLYFYLVILYVMYIQNMSGSHTTTGLRTYTLILRTFGDDLYFFGINIDSNINIWVQILFSNILCFLHNYISLPSGSLGPQRCIVVYLLSHHYFSSWSLVITVFALSYLVDGSLAMVKDILLHCRK